jgi:hypothetical protein
MDPERNETGHPALWSPDLQASAAETGYVDHRFSDESLAADRGSVPLLLLPIAFFFSPGRFMRSYGVHMGIVLFSLVLWITGASLVIQRFETGLVLGNVRTWFPQTWSSLLGVAISAGLLRGIVLYWVGGAWFKLRLLMCSVPWKEPWSKTNRIYFSAGIAKHLFYLGFVIYAATQFDTYILSIQEIDETLSMQVLIAFTTLQVWSSYTLYRGVVCVLPAKRIWAAVWFLVLPVLLRLSVLAFFFVLPFFSGIASPPLLDSPSTYQSESFEFEYPSNWFVTRDELTPGPEMWVQVEPFIGDALIEIQSYSTDPNEDLIELIRSDYEEYGGFEIVGDPEPISQLRDIEGSGRRYEAKIEHKACEITFFEVRVNDWSSYVIKMVVEKESVKALKPGFDHIMDTLRVIDHDEIPPNTARAHTVEQEMVKFEIPINWWYTPEFYEAFTDDDGTEYPDRFNLLIQTPGYGYFRVYVYQSSSSPRTELAVTIDSYSDTGHLIDERPLDSWLGLSGSGAIGGVQDEDGSVWELSVIIQRLDDGRMLEIRRGIYEPHRELQQPGFDLIERTFELNTP